MNLAGRNVLLTGATGGLGQAMARALHARGARLVLTGRRADVLEPLAEETGGRAIACDLADRAAVDALLAGAGPVDVLVANAALPASGPLDGFSEEEIERALDVNLRVPILMAKRLMAPMVERGEGQLVFVSSLSGKITSPGSALYSATKAGLRAFALGLRQDLRTAGVGVSTIFPGFISGAGMWAETGVQLPGYVRTKKPEDVADALIQAIERNRAEVDVAPVPVRVSAALANLAPELVANAQRRLGSEDISAQVAEAQRSKR